MAFAWSQWMRTSWATEPVERAVQDSLSALQTIEVLRDLQRASTGRAEMFTSWSEDYRWLSGRLLEEYLASGEEVLLARAFEVAARSRARALIDSLEAAQVAPRASAATTELQEQLAAVLADLARVQRRLLDPRLTVEERTAAKAELERLELAESDIGDRIERADPVFADLRRPHFAALDEVQSALARDQALLSFQVAPSTDLGGESAGGGWLMVVTRDGARVYRSLERETLRPAVHLFSGLFESRNGAEAAPAAQLARELLGTAIDDLPAEVTRLVVVPDDAVHQVPFAALRAGPGVEPLVARFEISVVPSATLWLRWSRDRPAPAPAPALIFADPRLPYGADSTDSPTASAPVVRSGVASGALRLPPLKEARREGRRVVADLGPGCLLKVGDEASEAFAKASDLGRFSILHFATHAVIDDDNPSRSAVLLAAGDATEDGLLQMREIVALHLAGRIVVLSSCRSASGELLRGEGVMGLARAFFQAGAHVVVASLWPLADADAADLFDRFYLHLADGASVAAALAAAQRDRRAAGAPAYAWAGVVALGDGDQVPVPGGVPHRAWGGVATLVVGSLAILLAAGAGWLRLRGWTRRVRR